MLTRFESNIFKRLARIMADINAVTKSNMAASIVFSRPNPNRVAVVGINGCLLYTSPSPRD